MKSIAYRQFANRFILFSVCLLPGLGEAQQYQNGYVYQNWTMSTTAWNIDTYFWPSRVSDANYFAQTFNFENDPNGNDGAYMGIQQLTGKGSRLAKFSIWNATAARPANAGVCRDFGGEGTGKTCDIPYDFTVGQWYRLRLWRLEADSVGQWWGAWIRDGSGQDSYIGSIRAPAGTGDISRTSTFNEYFGPANDCNQLPSSSVFVYAPYLNNRRDSALIDTPSIGACSAGSVTRYWNDKLSALRLGAIP